jgi:hypothetical protein
MDPCPFDCVIKSLLAEAFLPEWNIRFPISIPNCVASRKKPGLLAETGLQVATKDLDQLLFFTRFLHANRKSIPHQVRDRLSLENAIRAYANGS